MKVGDNKRFQGIFAITALTLLIFASFASAQTISLMAPAIANVSGTLTARFGVTVEEMPVLKGELEDGAELVLKCEVTLDKVHDYWLNSRIASARFESVLKFESLTKEFVMTLPGRQTPLKNADLPALLKKGWAVIETGLTPWSALERGQQYSLSLNTTINEIDAPDGITRFIYFWSWDAGANNTFQLNFTY